MRIRAARKEDLNQVAEIFAEAMSSPPYNFQATTENSAERIEYLFQKNIMLVAEEKDRILGFAALTRFPWLDALRGSLEELHVRTDSQGKGVGSGLLAEMERRCREEGISGINLSTHGESRAIDFYSKNGYTANDFIQMHKEL